MCIGHFGVERPVIGVMSTWSSVWFAPGMKAAPTRRSMDDPANACLREA